MHKLLTVGRCLGERKKAHLTVIFTARWASFLVAGYLLFRQAYQPPGFTVLTSDTSALLRAFVGTAHVQLPSFVGEEGVCLSHRLVGGVEVTDVETVKPHEAQTGVGENPESLKPVCAPW